MGFGLFRTDKGFVYANVDDISTLEKSRDDIIVRMKSGYEFNVVDQDWGEIYSMMVSPRLEGFLPPKPPEDNE